MRVYTGVDAVELRSLFVLSFVDTTSEYYHNYIHKQLEYSDGLHYFGYLWDCMKNRRSVSIDTVLNGLEGSPYRVYILWDDHSCDRVNLSDYWKFPKDAVLAVDSKEIRDIIPMLPEDCYFFDDTLSCAYALTHEESKPGRRFCIASNV